MPQTFQFNARIQFDAENIDDAFDKLREHFANVDDSTFAMTGQMKLNPVPKKE
jgi:hypothetical protein